MEARRLYQSSIPTSTHADASRANSYSLAEVDGQIVSPGRKPQRGPHDVSRFNPSKTNVPVTSGHPACNERSTHGWRRTDGGLAAIPTGRSDDAPPRRSRAQSLSTHRCRQRVGMKHKQRPHWRWRQKNVSPACKKKNPAAWSGGPKGRKIRKGTPLLPSYGWPAWCCNLKPCQRDCGFIEDRAAKAAELQSVYRPSDNEYLSEMISIRGTRCAPALLPSLPSLHAPCLTLLHAKPRVPAMRRLTVRFVCTQVLRALEDGYAW